MKKELMDKISLDSHSGCFGNFRINDPICKKLCALNLRCAIERDEKVRMELFEELISSDVLFMKTQ